MSAKIVGRLLVALATVVSPSACAKPEAAPTTAQPTVTFLTASGEVTVKVEVANNLAERAKGLMFRDSLAADSGMIFVFPDESEHSFWMKNTYISLDMIFLNKDAEVVGVIADAEPQTEDSRSIHAPSMYVVEVVGGFAARHGIVAKTPARLSHVPASDDKEN